MAQGNVEVWLGSLMAMAQKSLHNVIRQAHFAIGDANFQLLEFLNTFPAQVCVACRLFADFLCLCLTGDRQGRSQVYLTISRRKRGDYKPVITEPKAKWI